MKKTIFLMGCAVTAALLMFSGCKRNDVQPPLENAGNYLSARPAPVNAPGAQASRESSELGEPTGIAHISPDLFSALHSGQYVAADRIAPHVYKARDIINIDPWYDPCAQDWINFTNYFNSVYPAMKAYANATCRPVRGAWGGGVCIACVLFVVLPDYPPCTINIAYESQMAVYEAGPGMAR